MGLLKEKAVLLLTSILLIGTLQTYAGDKGLVLIELYTSEGCSSCPSAERLMPQLQKMYKDNLYVLEFHVDYWDRLGWEDPYSKKGYSTRQRMYTDVFGRNTVYTPQAIVNGKAHATGSDKTKLRGLIQKEISLTKTNREIQFTTQTSGNTITLNYDTELNEQEVINIALVQKTATTSVKRGENAGKELIHHNIVRSFKEKTIPIGSVLFNIPDRLTVKDCYIVAYIQRKDNLNIIETRIVNIQ